MNDIPKTKKPTIWYSPSLRQEVACWPKTVRRDIGAELNRVEYGGTPLDFKPLPVVGPSVAEIRVADRNDQYRLIYVAKFEEAVYVLHVITKKKVQKTNKHDIDLARKRYSTLIQTRNFKNE